MQEMRRERSDLRILKSNCPCILTGGSSESGFETDLEFVRRSGLLCFIVEIKLEEKNKQKVVEMIEGIRRGQRSEDSRENKGD